jgi:hypothetical protein
MGIDQIVALRMAGGNPGLISLEDERVPRDIAAECPFIVDLTGKNLDLVDWRFLAGLAVSGSSPSLQRAKKLFDLCCENGASLVYVTHIQTSCTERKKDDWHQFSKQPHTARVD